MRNSAYTALIFSLLIHLLIILLLWLTQSTAKPKFKEHKKLAIKSFLYRTPKVKARVEETKSVPLIKNEAQPKEPAQKQKNILKDKLSTEVTSTDKNSKPAPTTTSNNKPKPSLLNPQTETALLSPKQLPQLPKKKLDSFTQLQRLRSKLNRRAIAPISEPYQAYQPPSVFNNNSKTVPHSVPLKDEEKERKKNTKNMGAGIATTKGDDGRCSITQDMSVYGLSEGSSTQYFNCGESKFDKSFREHMKKVKTKLGRK